MSDHAQPAAARASVEERAQVVVEQTIARRRAGELVTDEQVLREHPELLGVLEKLLAKAARVEQARASAKEEANPLEKLLDGLVLDEPARAVRSAPLRRVETGSSVVAAEPPNRSAIDADARVELDLTAAIDPAPQPPSASAGSGPKPFRPECRPPTARLILHDDNQLTGEVVRVRDARLTIGRHAGEVRLRHDSRMSGKHALVERVQTDSGWQWRLSDLASTNGVFVRTASATLVGGDQMLMANRTVRYVTGIAGEADRLEEVRSDREGAVLDLRGEQVWVGRDAERCSLFLAEESMLDDRLARFVAHEGGWRVESPPSVNGLWLRVEKVTLASGACFQLGEQRFSFHLP